VSYTRVPDRPWQLQAPIEPLVDHQGGYEGRRPQNLVSRRIARRVIFGSFRVILCGCRARSLSRTSAAGSLRGGFLNFVRKLILDRSAALGSHIIGTRRLRVLCDPSVSNRPGEVSWEISGRGLTGGPIPPLNLISGEKLHFLVSDEILCDGGNFVRVPSCLSFFEKLSKRRSTTSRPRRMARAISAIRRYQRLPS